MLTVSLYRSLKSNPKEFKLADSARKTLMDIIDIHSFDVNGSYAALVTYGFYSTGYFLEETVDQVGRGEDYRNVEKAIYKVRQELMYNTLKKLRTGNIPDEALVVASYIHIGIAHDLIPNLRLEHSDAWHKLESEERNA